jgi:ParB-like chromosome segregation protein Spo0J
MQMPQTAAPFEIQIWPIDRFVLYARNPRKNDAVVDRMCSSIREFGFKIPVLARSDGEVVDGHLRIKAAKKLRLAEVPVILCDDFSPAQVKASQPNPARHRGLRKPALRSGRAQCHHSPTACSSRWHFESHTR